MAETARGVRASMGDMKASEGPVVPVSKEAVNADARHRIRISGRMFAATLALLCGAALLTSCASVDPPNVTLNSVAIEGVSLEGVELKLHTDVQNPNGFGADIGRLEYRIAIDGTEIANGQMSEEIHVPAGGSSEVAIPFTLTWEGIGEGVRRYLDGSDHRWKLSGSVRVSNGALSKTFPFSETGEFQSPDARDVEIDF